MTRRYTDPFGPPWRFQWVRLLFTWQGGILQMFWIEWLIAIGISALAVGITYAVTRDDIDQIELSDTVERLADAVNYIARRFQAAIALMLGFYSVQNINRWNQVRDVQGNVMGTVNDVAYRVALMLPDDNIVDERNDEAEEDGEEAVKSTKASISKAKLRLNLMRWLNLSHAIVIGDVYQTRHNEFNSLEKIRDKGLATEQEYYFLKEKQAETGFVFVAPLAWFVDLLEQLRREELFGVTEGMIGTLTGQLLTLRRALSDLYRFRNVPIPLSYRQLTNMTVRLYLLLLLLQAVLFEKDNEDSVGRLTRGSFWIILVFAFEYLLFVGWLTVADAIGNPFRMWADELEWENYVKGLNESSVLISSGFRDPSIDYLAAVDQADDMRVKMRASCDLLKTNIIKSTKPPPRGLKAKRKIVTGF